MAEVLLGNTLGDSETETEVLETETIQAFSVSDDASEGVLSDAGVSPLSVYDGSISSTYVEYFRGFASKLAPDNHYIFYRDGQYSYVFYYSSGLRMENGRVFGSADFYRLNTYNGYTVSVGTDRVDEDVYSGMVYSDFVGCPDLRGGEYYVQVSAVFVLCLIFVFMLLNVLYKLPKRLRWSGR